MRENHAIGGPMRDFEALARAREQHRVLADDVARAHDREADAAGQPRPAVAVPLMDRRLGEGAAARAGDGLAERDRRPGGRDQHGNLPGHGLEPPAGGRLETGDADEQGHALCGTGLGMGQDRLGGAEVERDGGIAQGERHVRAHQHAGGRTLDRRIPADNGTVRRSDRCRQAQLRRLAQRPHQALPHAAADAEQGDGLPAVWGLARHPASGVAEEPSRARR